MNDEATNIDDLINLIISRTYCEASQRDTDFCIMEYKPLCGSYGKIYSNPYMAYQNSNVEYCTFVSCWY